MLKPALLSVSLSLLVSVSARAAEDWPAFRGNHQGHAPEANVPLEWSAEKNIPVEVASRWKSLVVSDRGWGHDLHHDCSRDSERIAGRT